jgi:hypothetical protein
MAKIFYASLWADRITVKRTTGFSSYQLMFGMQCIVPVELDAVSWHVANWRYPMTTTELLAARTRQLARRDDDLEYAAKSFEDSRLKMKEYFDRTHPLRPRRIQVGDLVLLYETQFVSQWSRKFKNNWTGPYVVIEVKGDGSYRIGQ